MNSVVLFVPGQGKMPNSFKGFFLILLIGVSPIRYHIKSRPGGPWLSSCSWNVD